MPAPKSLRLALACALLSLPLLASALACVPGGAAATPTVAGCALPNLVGMNQAEASKALTGLGLAARRSERASDEPVGTVIATDPPAGAIVPGCTGSVTIIVSSGSGAAAATPIPQEQVEPTVTLQVPTRAPSSSGGGGEYFPRRDPRPVRWPSGIGAAGRQSAGPTQSHRAAVRWHQQV